MDPRQVTTADDARAIVEQRGLDYVKVGVFDVDVDLGRFDVQLHISHPPRGRKAQDLLVKIGEIAGHGVWAPNV